MNNETELAGSSAADDACFFDTSAGAEMESHGAPMSTYGITAIPAFILFAPDGTILLRRTISPEAVEARLESLLSTSGNVK